MPNTTEAQPLAAEIVLPARLDVLAAGSLKDWYLGLSSDARLDASDVEVVTTAGLQVMMAGRDWLADQGFSVEVLSPTGNFLRCLRVLGTDISRLTTQDAPPAPEVA